MGQKLENFPDVTAPDGTYVYGNIKDDTGSSDGTPFDVQTMADIYQTLARMAAQSGITLNDLPDNTANGYQFSDAFGGEAWKSGGAITFTAGGGGSITVDPGDIVYNKYHRVGKTVDYQLLVTTATIAGTVSSVTLTLPLVVATFPNNNTQFIAGTYNGGTTFLASLSGTNIILTVQGANFTVGTNNQSFSVNIRFEIA